MDDEQQPAAGQYLVGREAVDRNGDGLGQVAGVYFDDRTGQPTWVALSRALGGPGRLAPLNGSYMTSGDELVIATTKEAVEDSPPPPHGPLSAEDEDKLRRYYGALLGRDVTTSGYGARWDENGGMTTR